MGMGFYDQFNLVAQTATLGNFSYLHKSYMAACNHVWISIFEPLFIMTPDDSTSQIMYKKEMQ